MKAVCPSCGTDVFCDTPSVGQKTECPFCRHRFAIPAAALPTGSISTGGVSTGNAERLSSEQSAGFQLPDGRFAVSASIADRRQMAFGMTVTSWSWILSIVTILLTGILFGVFVISAGGRGIRDARGILTGLLVVFFLCGFSYVGGQLICMKACRPGGVLKLALRKTLRNWGIALSMRMVAAAFAFPPAKIVGAFFAARSLTAYLAFLSLLAVEIGRADLTPRIHDLDNYYRRSLGVLFGVACVFLLLPGAMQRIAVFLLLLGLGFLISVAVFSWRKAIVLLLLAGELRRGGVGV